MIEALSRDAVGLAVVLAAATLFYLSWLCNRSGRLPTALLLLTAGALLLRLFAASDLFLHEWDERYHALVAKRLMSDPLRPMLYDVPLLGYDFREWTANHVWVHKQPLSLWLMAMSMRLFGVAEIPARLPSVLLSSLAVLMTYRLGSELGGRRVGWIAGFLHATAGLLIALAAGRVATDHPDTLFIVLVEAGVLVAVLGRERGGAYDALLGALVGLAAMAKSPVALLVFLVWLPLVRHQGPARVAKRLTTAVLVAGLVWAPWQLHIRTQFPEEAAWERAYDIRHLTEPLEEHQGGPLYHLARIPRYFGELSLLSLVWFFAVELRRRREALRVAIAVWLAVPYLFFSLAATKMPAYVMVAAPAVFLIVALHWVHLRDLLPTLTPWRRRTAAVVLFLLIALPVRYCIAKIDPVGGAPARVAWAQQARQLAAEVAGREVVVFNAARPIELMFYAPVIAYSRMPTQSEVALCEERGYEVRVLEAE